MKLLKRNTEKNKTQPKSVAASVAQKSTLTAGELRHSKKMSVLSSLRCSPMPGWVAFRNDSVYALCRNRPYQNYWSPADMEELGLKSDVFEAYKLEESEGLPMGRPADIPPIMTSHVASVLHETEYVELRRNIGLEPCLLYGDKKAGKSLIKNTEKELLQQQNIGVWARHEASDSISENDIIKILELGMSSDMKEGGFVGINAESATMLETEGFSAKLKQHINVGAMCYSIAKIMSDEICEIGLQAGAAQLPHIEPTHNSYISIPQPDGTIESIIEPYSIILYSRPQLVAQGLRSPSLSQRSTEIIYLIKALNEQNMPSDSETISHYLSTRNSPFDEIATEGLLRQTQETLGENNMGKQRLYQDETGNWKHNLPAVKGEEENILGDEQWVWQNMVMSAFHEMAENIPELSTD